MNCELWVSRFLSEAEDICEGGALARFLWFPEHACLLLGVRADLWFTSWAVTCHHLICSNCCELSDPAQRLPSVFLRSVSTRSPVLGGASGSPVLGGAPGSQAAWLARFLRFLHGLFSRSVLRSPAGLKLTVQPKVT